MGHPSLNLINLEFDRSNLFQHLPKFESLNYEGHADDKIQRFKAVREGLEWTLLTATIIRRDEDFLWESARDLLDRAIKVAAQRMRGIYTFDLLTFDFHREIKTFNYQEIAQVLVNSSLKLKPGEQALVRYSSCYGLLQKMVEESWGKVVFETAVEVFRDKPSFLYTLLKRMLNKSEFARGPVIALVNDLSLKPLFDPADEIQKSFLEKFLTEKANCSIDFPPEVYLQDRNGLREI